MKKLTKTKTQFQRTKTNQEITSKLNIDLLYCLVSVARGTDANQVKKRSFSNTALKFHFKNNILKTK